VSVVIVIIALMAAVAFPRLQQMAESQRAANSVNSMERLLKQAREEAVRRQIRTEIVVRGSGFVLTAPEEAPPEDAPLAEDAVEGEISQDEELGLVIAQASLTDGAAFSSLTLRGEVVDEQTFVVGFFPDGSSDSAGVEIDVLGRVIHFTVSSASGGVRRGEGPLPVEEAPDWEAGQNEQRL
jgi:type II secretory pathway pseudopilin PulG